MACFCTSENMMNVYYLQFVFGDLCLFSPVIKYPLTPCKRCCLLLRSRLHHVLLLQKVCTGFYLARRQWRHSFINNAEGALSMPSLTQNQASKKELFPLEKHQGGYFCSFQLLKGRLGQRKGGVSCSVASSRLFHVPDL